LSSSVQNSEGRGDGDGDDSFADPCQEFKGTVLSSEKDPVEIRLNSTDRYFLKEASRRRFRKIRPSPIE
jgi:hypothetical protein